MPRLRAPILEVRSEHPEPHRLKRAVALFEAGKIVLYPTDSLYALGADIEAHSAIERLYVLRGLDERKPLSLICSDLSEVSRYATFDNDCFRFMRRVLPGPYTFILRATKEAPRLGQSKRRTVGVRVPRHSVAQELVRLLGRPLLTTSALHPSRESTVSDPVELADLYGADDVSLVLDAGILPGTPSTVIDWSGEAPEILRRGGGPVFDLE